MKLPYFEETGSLYLELLDRPSAETLEIANGFNVDLDASGSVVGFDIDDASARI